MTIDLALPILVQAAREALLRWVLTRFLRQNQRRLKPAGLSYHIAAGQTKCQAELAYLCRASRKNKMDW